MNEQNQSKYESQIVMPYHFFPYCPPEEDEIDLRKLWQVLKRRKTTVWFTTLIIFLMASIYLLIAKPVYEAKATLAIGKYLVKTKDGLATKFFDDAKFLKKFIDSKYDTAGKYRDTTTKNYLSSVSIPKKTDSFIILTAFGIDNKHATTILDHVIDEILTKHHQYMNSILSIKEHQLQSLKERLKYYKNVKFQQLQKELEIIKTVELAKLRKSLDLIKTIELTKIEDKIAFITNTTIPTLKQKIEETNKEIEKKSSSIQELQKKLEKMVGKDPTLAAMISMQIANLQNDIARLSLAIIDFNSKIEELKNITIQDLKNRKQQIIKEVIPEKGAEIKKLMEKIIPEKEAEIKKLLSMTIPQVEAQIDELKVSMKPPYIVPTQIVGDYRTHNYPEKPKKRLILIVSLITGLMLGIFLAFFIEFISKEKEA